jgi:hypothetical protein
MLVSSIIMRQSAAAESESQSERRDTATTRESAPFSLPLRAASARIEAFAATVDARRGRLQLDRIFDVVVSVAMLGGVFVVPVATLIAMICAWLPQRHPLHQTAPTFFAVASFWFIAALLLSHLQPSFGGRTERDPG